MGDVYSLEKARKKKKERNVEEDILEEAKTIEEQNYESAHGIRSRIDTAAQKQKEATEEMRRQGETLENSKKAAVSVHRKAIKGEKITEDIEREGRIFSCRLPCVDAIYKYFNKDPMDEEVEKIAQREEGGGIQGDEGGIQGGEGNIAESEVVPGQRKTDEELVSVLNSLKGIKSEAKTQSKEAERQKVLVKDISTVNDQSEKVIKRTDKHMKDID